MLEAEWIDLRIKPSGVNERGYNLVEIGVPIVTGFDLPDKGARQTKVIQFEGKPGSLTSLKISETAKRATCNNSPRFDQVPVHDQHHQLATTNQTTPRYQ